MPNRILKESVCTSDTIDGLSVEAERFFYRLLVQCDDYGRMDGRAAVLRARCFPLRLDSITDKSVEAWLKELIAADLLWLYMAGGKTYLQITNWNRHQQVRAKNSKYPDPPADGRATPVVIADDSTSAHVRPICESETAIHENREAVNESGDEKTPPPTPAPRKPKRDPRTDHPAVKAVSAVTGKRPPIQVYDRIITLLGDKPDIERLTDVYQHWRAHGYSPVNLEGWLFDWFVNGIPQRLARTSPNGTGPPKPDRFAGLRSLAEKNGITPKEVGLDNG